MSSRDAVLGVGASLATPPASVLVREAFDAELEQQRALTSDVGLADIAHIVVAIDAGIVPETPGAQLLAALLDLQSQADELVLDPLLGDVYTNREAWLTARCAATGWLGVGRARREAITTGYTLHVRRAALAFAREILLVAEALADTADEHTASLMPDYTYLQAGQPTTFAHYLLGFAYGALRDLARVRSYLMRLDRCPAGVGSTNGATLPLDRERLAELLGFSGLVEHARDAMWQADAPIEALAVTCAAIVNLDRLAEDLAIFSTAEFGFVELADAHSRASKVMPQKKNPYALSYVRAVANRIIGMQAGLAAAGRTPSGQMDNRLAAYGDVPRAFARVGGCAALVAEVLRDLSFDRVSARAALERSWSFASDLGELVMRAGDLDYRTAHALVGRASRALRAKSKFTPAEIDTALDAAAREVLGRPLHLAHGDIARTLDPLYAVARRDGIGGAAASSVAAMNADCRMQLAEFELWHARTVERTAGAERTLLVRARTRAHAS